MPLIQWPATSGSAVMPKLGSEFTYQVTIPTAQLQEQTTITSVVNDTFTATRKSDTLNEFWTSDVEKYVLFSTGDLLPPNDGSTCDSFPLPISSQQSLSSVGTVGIPTKLNGFVDPNSNVVFHTQYEGEESIQAAGTSFLCSQVSKTITVTAVSPTGSSSEVDTESIIHRYWYSPQLGFFVKDQELTQMSDSTTINFTRTLVSYKLGK
jgi:hypothetical protein